MSDCQTLPDPEPTEQSPAVLLCLAFVSLGLLVGTLLAFSAQSLAQAVVAAVFAFFGGSILSVLNNKSRNTQVATAAGTLGLSLGALLGVYTGIFVNEHQLLSPAKPGPASIAASSAAPGQIKYLRENLLRSASEIDQMRRTKAISTEEAYERLFKISTE